MKEKEPEFTVSDRRRYSLEDVLSGNIPEEPTTPAAEANTDPVAEPAAPSAPATEPTHFAAPEAAAPAEEPEPEGPTAEERSAGHAAYKQAGAGIEDQLKKQYGSGVSAQFEVNFERVIEPFYVTALMQLGMMGQEGQQRRVDIIGARQTIDTLEYLHAKCKGNLSDAEENVINTVLYQLRMAYVDITNALARGPAPGGAPPKK